MRDADASPRRDSLGTAFKIFGLASVLLILGYCAWFFTLPVGGVRLSNQMDAYALEYLEEHGILNGSEEVLAYYDVTVHMSGEEAAILTTERVLYHKAPRTSEMALAEIRELRHRTEPLVGDVIEIVTGDGRQMQIEIAPLNNGRTFWNALRRAAPAGVAVEEEGSATTPEVATEKPGDVP